MRAHQDYILTVASHELKTTLNAIAGWVRILRAEPSDRGQGGRITRR